MPGQVSSLCDEGTWNRVEVAKQIGGANQDRSSGGGEGDWLARNLEGISKVLKGITFERGGD